MSNDEARRLGLVPESELASALGLTAEHIDELVAKGVVFFVEREGVRLYPSFFIDATLDGKQVATVVKLLGNLGGSSKWQFFSTGKGSLGGLTPVDALRQGKLKQVTIAAEGFAER